MSTANERFIGALRDHGSVVQEAGDGRAMAQCPAHDDSNPSLSIAPRRDGKGIVLCCHANCQTADVVATLGLQMRDLYDDDDMAAVYNPSRDYVYPDGRKVHRKPDKSFPQTNAKGRKALFHADRIADADTVFWPEGEKDVEAIESVGGFAVCSAMGAGKAHLADVEPVRGKHVVIIADKDDAGRGHAAQVADRVRPIAASVTVVEALTGKDVADHIADDHSLDELVPVELNAGAGDVPDPVDGAEMLHDVERFAGQFLAFATTHHLVVVVLWAIHTWCVNAFYVTPRLILDSPEPGSGKTRVLEVLALLCRNAKLTLSTTTAALYRRIAAAGDMPPTVLQDEADAVFGKTANPQAEDLRALFNAGYKRGATVDRCEGDAKNMKVREFPVFAPVALAGLAGKMPATITDRAVTLHMKRRGPDEHVADFRERDAAVGAAPLRERLELWAAAHHDELADARPTMPQGVRDRPAEVWEALLAIADAAGGTWPERARAACRYFVLDVRADELSLGLRLLRDVRRALGGDDRMHSADVVAALTRDPESEWLDLWGKPLDQRRLAKELKRYDVESQDVRIGTVNRKGYLVAGDNGLEQAWRRYLPQVGQRDKRDKVDIAGQSVADVSRIERERDKRYTSATRETPCELQQSRVVADVADVAHNSVKPVASPRNGQSGVTVGGDGRCPECSWHIQKQGHCGGCQQRGGDV